MRRSLLIAVVRQVAIDYHSGMGSRGYRLQCRCTRWLQKRGQLGYLTFNPEMRALYNRLSDSYGRRL